MKSIYNRYNIQVSYINTNMYFSIRNSNKNAKTLHIYLMDSPESGLTVHNAYMSDTPDCTEKYKQFKRLKITENFISATQYIRYIMKTTPKQMPNIVTYMDSLIVIDDRTFNAKLCLDEDLTPTRWAVIFDSTHNNVVNSIFYNNKGIWVVVKENGLPRD